MTIEPHADISNRHVVQHLADNGFPAHTLNITTEPGDQWVRTVVRNPNPGNTWHQNTVDRLYDALRALPGHPHARCSDVLDRFVIIWDGV